MAVMGKLGSAVRAPVRVAAGAVALLALTTMTFLSGAPAEAATTCRSVSLTVSGGWVVNGQLCAPAGASTVLLLQHGATYSSGYWDFGVQPERYSFVDFANARGLATLNIDRLGNGTSSHPAPELVTTTAHADIAHQFVQGLRSGQFGQSFDRVVLVGHSLGSVIAVAEAGTYHDVDAVVLTALSHTVGTAFVTDFQASLAPAALVEPERFGGLPLGYLTTVDNARARFFHQPNADPEVIAHDEATKETYTDGEELTLIPGVIDTLGITAPVLNLVGRFDAEFCGLVADCANPLSLIGLESTYYPAAESFELRVIPDAGHNLNLQRNAQTTFGHITSWAASVG